VTEAELVDVNKNMLWAPERPISPMMMPVRTIPVVLLIVAGIEIMEMNVISTIRIVMILSPKRIGLGALANSNNGRKRLLNGA
jgi:hypothetical protein